MSEREMEIADFKSEQRKIILGVFAAFVLCTITLGGAHLYLPDFVELRVDDLESRLLFWAGANLLVIFWVMIGVGMVSTGRRHSPADIGGSAYSPPSPKIAVRVAFLQNTLEQAFITMFALLALVLLLGAPALPLVAASVLLFALGRVTFLAGYPHGAGARSFGMALTALPSLLAVLLSVGAVVLRLAL